MLFTMSEPSYRPANDPIGIPVTVWTRYKFRHGIKTCRMIDPQTEQPFTLAWKHHGQGHVSPCPDTFEEAMDWVAAGWATTGTTEKLALLSMSRHLGLPIFNIQSVI